MLKASFYGLETLNEPIQLTNVISIDNPNQTDEAFHAFINLVNQHRGKIKKLIIIESSFLHRHYNRAYLESAQKSSWLEFNIKYLKQLQVPHKIIFWETILKSIKYKAIYKKVIKDFEGDLNGYEPDKEFRSIIVQTAKKFTHKGSVRAIVDYLLEECTVALTLSGNLTYPGELNPALKFCLKKHQSNLNFILYKITGKRTTINSTPSGLSIFPGPGFGTDTIISFKPSFFAMSVAAATDTIIKSEQLKNKEKASFLSGYLEYCQNFMKGNFASGVHEKNDDSLSKNLDSSLINTQLISMLFDYLNINFFVIDEHGRYLAKNNTYVVPDALHADKIDKKSWQSCLEVIKTENSQIIEEEYQNNWYLSIKAPFRVNNKTKGVIGISIDITELKKTQAQLQATLNKLDGMTLVSASIAHELRTPLATIQMAAESLKRYLPILIDTYSSAIKNSLVEDPIQSRHLNLLMKLPDNLLEETLSAFTFIDMLLVKIKSTVDIGEVKIFSIKESVFAAIERYPFLDDQKKLIDCMKVEHFLIKGNPTLIVHIIFNLLKNSLYYIAVAGKGKITIWTQHGPNENQLFFKDTGTGISPEILPKIFDRFFTKTHHGAGVGLAFCRMAMEAFGGSIHCESTEGEYTLFILKFPKTIQGDNL